MSSYGKQCRDFAELKLSGDVLVATGVNLLTWEIVSDLGDINYDAGIFTLEKNHVYELFCVISTSNFSAANSFVRFNFVDADTDLELQEQAESLYFPHSVTWWNFGVVTPCRLIHKTTVKQRVKFRCTLSFGTVTALAINSNLIIRDLGHI